MSHDEFIESDFHFIETKFDFCNNNNNPLNNINFYKNDSEAISSSRLNIRKLVPEMGQCKNRGIKKSKTFCPILTKLG